ncbi:hypothetical protein LTS14_001044 [Recurvomyces mirabilis]|nr:hypothetical protein LTS14_001044 [Recurvomyces mirabilis]
MQWQQGRRTTRPKDQAYSLLGIFNVHMSLLYGEGKKARLRLEMTIFEELQQPYQSRLTLDFFASNELISEPVSQRQHSRAGRPLALVRFSDIEGEVLWICGYQRLLERDSAPVRKKMRKAASTAVAPTHWKSDPDYKEPSKEPTSPLKFDQVMETAATIGAAPDIDGVAAIDPSTPILPDSQNSSMGGSQLFVPLQQQLEPIAKMTVRERQKLTDVEHVSALQAGQTWRGLKPEDWHGDGNQSAPMPMTRKTYPAQSHADSHRSLDLDEANRGLCPLASCGRHVKDLEAHMLSHQTKRTTRKVPCPDLRIPYERLRA